MSRPWNARKRLRVRQTRGLALIVQHLDVFVLALLNVMVLLLRRRR